MALETIDADRGKIVTGTAKMRGVGKRDRICIGSGNCMTVQTFREAVLFAARAFEHSFIALVLEEFHVIAPHEVGVFDTGITPALMSRGAIIPVNARLLSPFTPGTLGGPTHAAVATGASLVMPGADLSGPAIASLIVDEKVTVAAGVPTIWMNVLLYRAPPAL